jgi:hypothetical protein
MLEEEPPGVIHCVNEREVPGLEGDDGIGGAERTASGQQCTD